MLDTDQYALTPHHIYLQLGGQCFRRSYNIGWEKIDQIPAEIRLFPLHRNQYEAFVPELKRRSRVQMGLLG